MGQHYKLVRPLGEGGMASVWVATNETLEVDVAIKFIRADLDDPNLADRLLREARAAARLRHPAIVRIFEFGRTEGGDPYIVMELLDGETLANMLQRRGRLPALRVVRLLLPVVHALATAHEKGIVHRDLKPDNIFLVPSEGLLQPKLLDFGIAKLDRVGDEQRITKHGVVAGTPGYMSPEQARGDDVDQRTDIWALCVVLYEALTGRLPFDGASYNALLRSIIEDEAPPVTNFAAGDDELWGILVAGLAKDPDQRWGSMRAFGTALASWAVRRGATEDLAGTSLHSGWLSPNRAGESVAPEDGDETPSTSDPNLPRHREAPTEAGSLPVLTAPRLAPVRPRRYWLAGVALAGLAIAIGLALLMRGGSADTSTVASESPASEVPAKEQPAPVVDPPVAKREPDPAPRPQPSASVAPPDVAPALPSAAPIATQPARSPGTAAQKPAAAPSKKLEIKTEL